MHPQSSNQYYRNKTHPETQTTPYGDHLWNQSAQLHARTAAHIQSQRPIQQGLPQQIMTMSSSTNAPGAPFATLYPAPHMGLSQTAAAAYQQSSTLESLSSNIYAIFAQRFSTEIQPLVSQFQATDKKLDTLVDEMKTLRESVSGVSEKAQSDMLGVRQRMDYLFKLSLDKVDRLHAQVQSVQRAIGVTEFENKSVTVLQGLQGVIAGLVGLSEVIEDPQANKSASELDVMDVDGIPDKITEVEETPQDIQDEEQLIAVPTSSAGPELVRYHTIAVGTSPVPPSRSIATSPPPGEPTRQTQSHNNNDNAQASTSNLNPSVPTTPRSNVGGQHFIDLKKRRSRPSLAKLVGKSSRKEVHPDPPASSTRQGSEIVRDSYSPEPISLVLLEDCGTSLIPQASSYASNPNRSPSNIDSYPFSVPSKSPQQKESQQTSRVTPVYENQAQDPNAPPTQIRSDVTSPSKRRTQNSSIGESSFGPNTTSPPPPSDHVVEQQRHDVSMVEESADVEMESPPTLEYPEGTTPEAERYSPAAVTESSSDTVINETSPELVLNGESEEEESEEADDDEEEGGDGDHELDEVEDEENEELEEDDYEDAEEDQIAEVEEPEEASPEAEIRSEPLFSEGPESSPPRTGSLPPPPILGRTQDTTSGLESAEPSFDTDASPCPVVKIQSLSIDANQEDHSLFTDDELAPQTQDPASLVNASSSQCFRMSPYSGAILISSESEAERPAPSASMSTRQSISSRRTSGGRPSSASQLVYNIDSDNDSDEIIFLDEPAMKSSHASHARMPAPSPRNFKVQGKKPHTSVPTPTPIIKQSPRMPWIFVEPAAVVKTKRQPPIQDERMEDQLEEESGDDEVDELSDNARREKIFNDINPPSFDSDEIPIVKSVTKEQRRPPTQPDPLKEANASSVPAKKGLLHFKARNPTGQSAAATRIKKRKQHGDEKPLEKAKKPKVGYEEEMEDVPLPPMDSSYRYEKKGSIKATAALKSQSSPNRDEPLKVDAGKARGANPGLPLRAEKLISLKGKDKENKTANREQNEKKKERNHDSVLYAKFIECDGGCKEWYHLVCAGLRSVDEVPKDNFLCSTCKFEASMRASTSSSNDPSSIKRTQNVRLHSDPLMPSSSSSLDSQMTYNSDKYLECASPDCPMPKGTQDDQVDTIERLIGRLRGARGLFWLVKWFGYELSEATWEPEDDHAFGSLCQDFKEEAVKEGKWIADDREPILLQEALDAGLGEPVPKLKNEHKHKK